VSEGVFILAMGALYESFAHNRVTRFGFQWKSCARALWEQVASTVMRVQVTEADPEAKALDLASSGSALKLDVLMKLLIVVRAILCRGATCARNPA
jgi:hypothetical protein